MDGNLLHPTLTHRLNRGNAIDRIAHLARGKAQCGLGCGGAQVLANGLHGQGARVARAHAASDLLAARVELLLRASVGRHEGGLETDPTRPPEAVGLLGVEGAQLLATGIALAFRDGPFSRDRFFEQLLSRCRTPEFCRELDKAASARRPDDLASLGNGVEAPASVPTALAVFALFPDDYIQTTGNAVLLGGDTDTIAAMAGALCGSRPPPRSRT